MAKISKLPIVAKLLGDEQLPVVQAGVTKGTTMAAFRDLIVPFLQNWYKGDRGDPGAAENTYDSVDALRGSDPLRRIASLAGDATVPDGRFNWETKNAPYTDDGSSTIAPDQNGAWVRQTADGIKINHPLGAPVYAKLLGDLVGQEVNATLFCKMDGRRDDGQNYQELIDKKPRQIIYPQGRELATTRQIRLASDMRHRLEPGSGILADVNDYGFAGLGLTGGDIGPVLNPIFRFERVIEVTNASELRPGDMIQIAYIKDLADIINEPNIVDRIVGTSVYLRYELNVSMPDRTYIRVYHVYAPVKNVVFDGYGRLSNVNAKGGGIRFNMAHDVSVKKLRCVDIGYIALSFENTIGVTASDLYQDKIGATGFGLRSVKQINLTDFFATGIMSDEAISAYYNVSGFNLVNIFVRQYLFGAGPKGSTAGNNILFDKLCARITMTNINCEGSATYNIIFNDQTYFVTISNFHLMRSNLGGIRIANGCDGITIGIGSISDVTDAVTPQDFGEASGQPTAGVMIDPTNRRCGVSGSIDFDRIASGRGIVDRQAKANRKTTLVERLGAGTTAPAHSVSGVGTIGVQSPDFEDGKTGDALALIADGDACAIQAQGAGDRTPKPLKLQPYGSTVEFLPKPYPSNEDAKLAGLKPGHWYMNSSNQNALTPVV
ncbi:hypothetical protein [Sphingomonas pseudosanguinis]|uniref:Uncharacterized protein n=1 Tax=Sphingomonas pseudosanguinis TaxID=413712 RepID=A0A7W6F1P0_9SPHN|nr:hypothetical protein [Sphingomonas pseudosanguinis]MBB3877902.1 hypothetical protein [Sphingomonas pseudosanguinis]MBN3537775.1 hypothetical protein [Sphingomonas pseudosanguinis]